jgi:peptidoglycan/xylan/chitin deacetylase (PgdA/CDA1 family)
MKHWLLSQLHVPLLELAFPIKSVARLSRNAHWQFLATILNLFLFPPPVFARPVETIPEKLVVLTFDDAVKSHRTFVAPLLKELNLGATFFVTHKWMDDTTNFMTWQDIAEIHEMGFEIGNHSWTHDDFSSPRNAGRLAAELFLVNRALTNEAKPPVPQTVSFAFCGNSFGPEAVQRLAELGYKFARRGEQPEAHYGTLEIGATFDPKRHHPLLIPTTGDAYPNWSLEHLKKVLARAIKGQAVVLQFHGSPDIAHPWVHTPPERLREYLVYLKENGYRCIAIRDLEPFIDRDNLPEDPMLSFRQPPRPPERLRWPAEVVATRKDPSFWLKNMLVDHRYSWAEAARAAGWTTNEVKERAAELNITPDKPREAATNGRVHVLPYPGTRETRRGFFANVDAQRGTKASVFLPWDPASYVVVDLPEAIFSERRLLFLAHTDVPTIWDKDNVIIENVDWERQPDGSLLHERTLANKIAFGASVIPKRGSVEMELWLRNGTEQPLARLRTQICTMLKGAPAFNDQTTTNKIFKCPSVAVHSAGGDRWILMAWERCGRAWGQPLVPCLHADPIMADCAPGETVRVRGRLWFYEGKEVEREIETASADFK